MPTPIRYTRERGGIRAANGKWLMKPGGGPLDEAMAKLALWSLPAWRATGATPNVVTTVGLACSALSVGMLAMRKPAVGVPVAMLMVFLRTYLDNVDGMMARAYSLESHGGDLYDHAVDVSWAVAMLATVAFVLRGWRLGVALGVFATAFTVSAASIGCVGSACGRDCQHGDSISLAKRLCPAWWPHAHPRAHDASHVSVCSSHASPYSTTPLPHTAGASGSGSANWNWPGTLWTKSKRPA